MDSDLFAGLSVDGGNVRDAGGDARSNGDAARSDSGGGGNDGGPGDEDSGQPPGTILPALCGSAVTCTSGDPTCCATQGDGFTTSTSYACTSNASTCNATSDAPVQCRDNNDCGGSRPFCCGELLDVSGQGGYASVSCESSCDAKSSDGGLTPHVPFCSTGTPNACTASGFTCQASSPLPGFNVCGPD